MERKQYGTWSILRWEIKQSRAEFASGISMDWMIICVVLLSTIVQLVLAFGGALRYRSGSSVMQLVIWLAYMSADALATSALGILTHPHSCAIFGIWAPILLLHLGGPDSISAYSTQDNELWSRRLLKMLFRISVAAYVVYLSQAGGYLLAAALLLLTVGVYKCAERTMALRSSSISQIVRNTDLMNTSKLKQSQNCNYPVMEVKQRGRSSKAMVTINEVCKSEGEQTTEKYQLCLSHALFNMVKRRYANLYLNYNTTRKFFFDEELSHISHPENSHPEKMFTVAEMELKFLYDFLFSKSSGTAFSKLGTIMRLVSLCLLGVAGFLFYSELRSQSVAEEVGHLTSIVAYVVLSVVFVLEVVQFCRILSSDWTMVCLICARIQHIDRSWAMPIQFAIQTCSCFRKLCQGKYWRNQIPQYSIIHTCSHIPPCIWNLSKFLRLTGFVRYLYTDAEFVGDDLKSFILDQLKKKCLQGENVDTCRERLMSVFGENNWKDLKCASSEGHEHLILKLHTATEICAMQYDGKERGAEPSSDVHDEEIVKRNVGLTKQLSRYRAYLLVSTPKLLPVNPYSANLQQMDVHSDLVGQLVGLADVDYNTMENYRKESILGQGAVLARWLQREPEHKRWEIISEYWSALIIFYAMKNKASIHVGRLVVGGEFLTLLWVILSHMGVGDDCETSGLESVKFFFSKIE